MPPIADTGWLVAFWNARDVHHDWARHVEITAPPLVCEAVLTEAAWLLGTPTPLLSMLAAGDIKTAFSAESEAAALLKWLAKYEDIDPGFADACVVRMAEQNPKRPVLTLDRRDFSIYRTLSGKPVHATSLPNDIINNIFGESYYARVRPDGIDPAYGRNFYLGGSVKF